MHVTTNFCCLCLDNSNELASVDTRLNKDENGILIKDKLEYCVPEYVIINHVITKRICRKCLLNLNNFFTFKHTCIRSSVTINEFCNKLPLTNEPNKPLTLSLAKVLNKTPSGNNESNIVAPTEIKSTKKYENKKWIRKKFIPPANNKNTLETEVQTAGITGVKRGLLPTDAAKNKIFQTTNAQTVDDNSKRMRLLLPKQNNMTDTFGNILQEPCFLSNDTNITYVPAVGNSVEVQNNRHLDLMQTVGINEIDGAVVNEIKCVVTECEDTEIQDGRQKISEDAVLNEDSLVKNKTTSEIDYEDLIQKNDIDILKYKYLYVKGKYPNDTEFKHTYSLSETQFQQNSSDFEIVIKEDSQTTDYNIPERQNYFNIFKNNVNKIEMNKNSIVTYQCYECNKIFRGEHNLREHEKIHLKEDHECKICKTNFFLKCILDAHICDQRFECSFCKKKFLQKSHLQTHESIHVAQMKYECSICKEKFEKQIDMLYHEKTHNVYDELLNKNHPKRILPLTYQRKK